ncbi:MAG: T9SS type A sorting domain-containing protein [FCB group bacterium]|nr:T9SS type A sorting domain-containing protein [FCB group bacterium]
MRKTIFIVICSCAAVLLSAQVMTLHFDNGRIDTLRLDELDNFYFSDTTAEVVRLRSPFHTENNVSRTPVFSWQHISGKQYALLLSEDEMFSDTVLHIAGLDSNAFIPTDPLNINTRYFWKVRISDKALWSAPWSFTTWSPSVPQQMHSLALLQGDSPGSLRFKTSIDSQIDTFVVILGFDGLVFTDTLFCDTNHNSIGGLDPERCYFVRIAGKNSAGTGPFSEVLSAQPLPVSDPVLIVNGFDRPAAGNTNDFVRQHARAVVSNSRIPASASNEAVMDELIDLRDYYSVIWILGEESTVDETFNTREQNLVREYLMQGGNLFVSGSEIAWDLDFKGSASDRAFCRDYLKIQYVQDSPNNAVGVYYQVESTGDTIFSDLASFHFDNGTYGTYNVRYPDVIKGYGDKATGFLKYTGCSTGFAGVVYEGPFTGGTKNGKVMILGFPFETIRSEAARNAMMEKFFIFLEQGLDVAEEIMTPVSPFLYQNYPNPFNATTLIKYFLPKAANTELFVCDMNGRKLHTLICAQHTEGFHEIKWHAGNHPAGVYVCILKSDGEIVQTKKMILLK